MLHQGLKFIKVGSYDDPGLTLAYCMERSNFATKVFIWSNVTMMNSLEIIAACDLKVGLYSKLNE